MSESRTAELRTDLALVAEHIAAGSRVLDLGCGSGSLLHYLINQRDCAGTGVEIDDAKVVAAIRAGVPVIELDLNTQLDEFAADSYDTVVLSRTLQAVRYPALVLRHMGRIASRCIVSVPNFGQWRNRLALISGHMPISRDLPWQWYDSPNVRYTTLKDLETFFDTSGFRIDERIPLNSDGEPLGLTRHNPNLFAGSAIYVLSADPTRDWSQPSPH